MFFILTFFRVLLIKFLSLVRIFILLNCNRVKLVLYFLLWWVEYFGIKAKFYFIILVHRNFLRNCILVFIFRDPFNNIESRWFLSTFFFNILHSYVLGGFLGNVWVVIFFSLPRLNVVLMIIFLKYFKKTMKRKAESDFILFADLLSNFYFKINKKITWLLL